MLERLSKHKSETLVRTTARLCGFNIDLGAKGKTGILQSMETCEEFVSRSDKAVVFYYTPKLPPG